MYTAPQHAPLVAAFLCPSHIIQQQIAAGEECSHCWSCFKSIWETKNKKYEKRKGMGMGCEEVWNVNSKQKVSRDHGFVTRLRVHWSQHVPPVLLSWAASPGNFLLSFCCFGCMGTLTLSAHDSNEDNPLQLNLCRKYDLMEFKVAPRTSNLPTLSDLTIWPTASSSSTLS